MKGRRIAPSIGSCHCEFCVGKGAKRIFLKRYWRRWERRDIKEKMRKGHYEN